MKVNRHGQATPLSHEHYLKIRRHTLDDRHRLLLDIAYYTGERWGTILRLRSADVLDGEGKPRSRIVFARSLTKNKSTREVPLHPDLVQILSNSQLPTPHSPLFPFTISAADKQFRRAIARAGLSHLGYSTYSTRRGFITQLSQRGTAIRVIQKLTGHKSLASLQRYIEVSDRELTNAIGGIGR